MRSDRIRLRATWLLLGATAASGLADVFSSEFFSDPVSEGWELVQEICAETRVDDGWYYQRFDHDVCPLGSSGGQDAYVRWITEFNGQPRFFLQFRVQTDGDRSEIPGGAPALMSMFNFAGVIYRGRGKVLRTAVQEGFNRSRLTILDANITTLLTAIILYYYGRGPVQGFGVTLAVGIVSSVICALFVTRLLVELVLSRSDEALKI